MAELESTETNFEADLEQMLQETEQQIESAGDDDIIEQLLVDEGDASEAAMTAEEEGDLVDSLLEGSLEADNTLEEQPSGMNAEDIEALLDNSGESTDTVVADVDEFSEDDALSAVEEDEFSEDEEITIEPAEDIDLDEENSAPSEETAAEESLELDTTLDDISFENVEGMDEIEDIDDLDDVAPSFELSDEDEEPESFLEPDIPEATIPKPDTPDAGIPELSQSGSAPDSSVTNEQNERIRLLENEISELKRHGDIASVLDGLEKSAKKAKHDAEAGMKKLQIWIFSTLGVAVLAMIIACLVFFFNSGVEEDVMQLESALLDIEDKIAIPLLNPNDKKISDIQVQVRALKKSTDKAFKEVDLLSTSQNQGAGESLNAQNKTLLLLTEKLVQLEQEISGLKKQKVTTKVVSKPKRVVKSTKKKPVKKVVKKIEWVVNLAAFKQRWYTDKKVEDYQSKGIRAEVLVIDIGGVDWFRIRVGGFNNKNDAWEYAKKVKPILNLSSVWVSKK